MKTLRSLKIESIYISGKNWEVDFQVKFPDFEIHTVLDQKLDSDLVKMLLRNIILDSPAIQEVLRFLKTNTSSLFIKGRTTSKEIRTVSQGEEETIIVDCNISKKQILEDIIVSRLKNVFVEGKDDRNGSNDYDAVIKTYSLKIGDLTPIDYITVEYVGAHKAFINSTICYALENLQEKWLLAASDSSIHDRVAKLHHLERAKCIDELTHSIVTGNYTNKEANCLIIPYRSDKESKKERVALVNKVNALYIEQNEALLTKLVSEYMEAKSKKLSSEVSS